MPKRLVPQQGVSAVSGRWKSPCAAFAPEARAWDGCNGRPGAVHEQAQRPQILFRTHSAVVRVEVTMLQGSCVRAPPWGSIFLLFLDRPEIADRVLKSRTHALNRQTSCHGGRGPYALREPSPLQALLHGHGCMCIGAWAWVHGHRCVGIGAWA